MPSSTRLLILSLSVTVAPLDGQASGAAATAPVVEVTGGKVRGQAITGGGAVYLGIPYARPPVGADTALSDVMQTYWTNFAKTGNPNGPGVPRWPMFDAALQRYMVFTEKGATPGQELRKRYCDLFLESTTR